MMLGMKKYNLIIILVIWNVFKFISPMISLVEKRIKNILNDLPSCSGVYQFFNEGSDILYVGKAINIKKRVAGYFTKNQTGKTKILVNKIRDIKIIITESEHDALLLENSLIKKYKPPYNILLKDDKTYPWICISNEEFPRVFSTRKRENDGGQYFGPYTSVKMINTLLNLIKELFELRDCNLNLSKEKIQKSAYKVCLEYHIGNCKGPCVGEEKEKDYLIRIEQIKNILKGNLIVVQKYLKERMKFFALELDFESAQKTKESLNLLQDYKSKSYVVSTNVTNTDVFGIYQVGNQYFLNYFKIVNGAIIQSHNAELKIRINESIEDVLMHYITLLRTEFNSDSKLILIPFKLNYNLPGVKLIVPLKGQKKELIDLSFRNAKFYGLEKINKKSIQNTGVKTDLLELQRKLHLKELPIHIECFDNSNIQGDFPVSACVVFKNGKPSKKDYRHFNIKTVKGPNDYASMEEVIERRYSRMLKENSGLPNLIIIDGGKGQLSSAVSALKEIGLDREIAIIGIAKKLEEIFFPKDPYPLYIDKNNSSLKLIQYCRNEAHRFSINHHRNRRSKGMIITELDNIKGIGPKTKEVLLKKYKSIKNIKMVSKNELTKDIGSKKADIIVNYFTK